jgi:molybdate transport system ATP-binding protein
VTLTVDVYYTVGRLVLDVDLSFDGRLTALVGPSGAGKTTVLNIIAGLVRPSRGVVCWDDEVWLDTTRGVWRPAHERRIGYVFQDARLFPHLTVRHNLTFGRWFGRDRSTPIEFDDVVSLLGLSHLLDRRPAKLSGGEAQRVALARALLVQPRLLLLDEPLASVDIGRREEVLPYLDRLREQIGLPTIYVTHAIGEVEGRAGKIIRIEDGRVRTASP